MHGNIWKQFQDTADINITDYEWTEKVKKEFYSIPFHKELLTHLKTKNLSISWILDCEPMCNLK